MSENTPTYAELMQSGRAALNTGRREDAHRIWKQAAALDPYNEQVWLALLEVIDEDADRRVCLQNILQINALNVQARRELNRLESKMQRTKLQEEEMAQAQQGQRRRRRTVLLRALFLGLAIGLSGAFFAIVISILLYAR
jgi:DNA-binding SARP family transcriptional activator